MTLSTFPASVEDPFHAQHNNFWSVPCSSGSTRNWTKGAFPNNKRTGIGLSAVFVSYNSLIASLNFAPLPATKNALWRSLYKFILQHTLNNTLPHLALLCFRHAHNEFATPKTRKCRLFIAHLSLSAAELAWNQRTCFKLCMKWLSIDFSFSRGSTYKLQHWKLLYECLLNVPFDSERNGNVRRVSMDIGASVGCFP